jgi:hypothetical protein
MNRESELEVSEKSKIFSLPLDRHRLYFHSPICPHHVLYRDNFTLSFQFSVYFAGLYGSRRLRLPGFLDIRHVRMARLSPQASFTPHRRYPWYLFF